MNKSIYDYVKRYNESKGLDTTDQEIIETIRDGEEVWCGNYDSCRWWSNCFKVVRVDDMLIGFDDAETTGDESPRDKGWEFDPNSICEVESYTKLIINYKPKA